MPFGYGMVDHCAFILDIPIELLVGIELRKIVCPASQRLNSRLQGCSKAYIDSLEGNFTRHRLLKWLHEAHTGGYSAKETAWKVIIIDKEGKAYMRRTEKICRKIKCCCNPFLPEASIWISHVQVSFGRGASKSTTQGGIFDLLLYVTFDCAGIAAFQKHHCNAHVQVR
jgi:hypothetical protein